MSLHFPTIELKDADPVDAVTAALDELTKSVDDRLKAIETKSANVADAGELSEVKATLAKIEAKLSRPGIITDRKADDGRTIEQKAFETFLRKGKDFVPDIEQKALTVANDASAGYLVAPEPLQAEILKKVALYSPMRSVARVTTISGGGVTFPRRTDEATAAWVDETDDRSETTLAYTQQNVKVHEAACWVDVSNKLLEDSAFGLEAEIATELGLAFAKLEAAAFVTGAGSDRPSGFMVDPSVLTMPSGSATTITADSLIDLYHSIPSTYVGQAVWAMNRQTMAAVRKLKAGDGSYLWSDSFAAGNPPTILGRPVVEFPDLANIAGGARPIAFGDFGTAYRIFDRVGLSIMRDPYTQAGKGIVRFHARRRVGGAVVMGEAVKTLSVAAS
ncbi:phage major capsid protein [Xanthobacter wiegelii]|uniref:phage major capsid protein n=1 Tax=Xanthobacter wiegelii TaxID=3119913 RepID=UPI0037288F36